MAGPSFLWRRARAMATALSATLRFGAARPLGGRVELMHLDSQLLLKARNELTSLSFIAKRHEFLTPKFGGGVRGFASGNLPPHEVVTMPALSPTMTQGNVGQWKKQEGDKVAAGEVLCTIETDKATLDLECMEDGILAKIISPAGTKDVLVGKPLCIIAESNEGLEKFSSSGGVQAATKQQAPPPLSPSPSPSPTPSPSQASAPPPSNLPPHQVLAMPALSPTMTQGNVGKWKKNEGDKVAAGDVLCDIETDKATLDFETLEDGVLAKILIPSGSKDVPVGNALCVIAESEEGLSKFANYSGGGGGGGGGQPAPQAKQQAAAAPAPAPSSAPPPAPRAPRADLPAHQASTMPALSPASRAKGLKLGPAVKKLLAESGLDASQIQGTGPRGMLVKGDVLAAMEGGTKGGPGKTAADKKGEKSKTPDAPLSFQDIPNTPIRKIIAKRLLESKNGTPHCYLQLDTILDATLRFRKELKDKYGANVSVNDFVIKAAALALKEVPEANAFWDDKAGDRRNNKSVDISIAVATDKGLITPIVKNADQKSLSTISAEVKSLAGKAKEGKLKPHEFQGGTFSISNLGMFQVDHFCAIINPPQACILAVGRGVRKVVWDEDNDGPKTVTEMLVTISVDHRVYDGDTTGRFLAAFKRNLSNPHGMLL